MSDLPSSLVYSLVTRMSAPVALVGPDWQEAYEAIREKIGRVSPQDLLEVQGETLGIDAVRTIEEFLAFVPGSGVKYVLVLGADNLTPEAQNAFLKTLEEPPRYARIFMFCQRWSNLLSTVRSRVVNVPLPAKPRTELQTKSAWEYLMSSGSKNVLEQLRRNYDWASQVLNGDLLFSKEMDSYKLAAFYFLLIERKAPTDLLREMLELESAMTFNVNTEMIFDRILMTGVKVT
ncbi:MAG TPA: hypothetical protein GX508_02610 [Coprothermobacter sp.]|nr:hypothetical protein [Coprothermobacter sp.]